MLKINNNIAQTGLRILFLIQLLIKGPISKAGILEEISKNASLRIVSPDTITLDINTLKSVGFDIVTGNKSNNYCYELKLSPIKIKLTKKEIKALVIARKAMFHFMDFRYIISIYETFKKISKLIESDEQAQTLLNFGNILKTNFKILKELDVHARHNNEIIIFYSSPSGKKREMQIRCVKLEYSKKNDKLYLWGVCEEYGNVYLRTDHIKKIIKIVKINAQTEFKPNKCIYTIFSTNDSEFSLSDREKIIKITPEYIQIRKEYLNEFYLKQKLLSYGENLIGVDNPQIKKQLIEIIQEVEEMYI